MRRGRLSGRQRLAKVIEGHGWTMYGDLDPDAE
jgi:hypothetical protein